MSRAWDPARNVDFPGADYICWRRVERHIAEARSLLRGSRSVCTWVSFESVHASTWKVRRAAVSVMGTCLGPEAESRSDSWHRGHGPGYGGLVGLAAGYSIIVSDGAATLIACGKCQPMAEALHLPQ